MAIGWAKQRLRHWFKLSDLFNNTLSLLISKLFANYEWKLGAEELYGFCLPCICPLASSGWVTKLQSKYMVANIGPTVEDSK